MSRLIKSSWLMLPLLLLLWCPPVSAKYCSVKEGGTQRSCIYKIDRIPKNSQIVISYTAQGWSMLIVVFLDEFAILEGPATVRAHKGEIHTIEHINTHRDMLESGRMMEAAIYRVSEDLLREMGNSRGKIRFWLKGEESREDIEVEVSAGLFSDIDEYIEETKTELGVLFKD